MSSVWSGLSRAPTFEKGQWFNPGSIHDVMIKRCILKDSQQSGLGFIAECEILTSQATGEVHPQTGQPFYPLPVGVDATWWQGLTDKNVGLPAVKGFIFALLGFQPNDPRCGTLEAPIPGSEAWPGNRTRMPVPLIENLMDHATGQDNILQGLFVHVTTKLIKTQKRGQDFTVHNWTPINFQAMNIPPPNVDEILRKASLPPADVAGWGQPQGYGPPQGPPGWGQPPQQQAPAWGQRPPQGPGHIMGSPPAGPGYGQAQPQGWGQPPPQGYQQPPQGGPPPGINANHWNQVQQPPQGPPQAPAWGPPQGPPPGPQQPPQGYGPPPQQQPPQGYQQPPPGQWGPPQAPAWGQQPPPGFRRG